MVDQNKELLYYGIRNGRLVPIRSIEESIPGEDQYDIDEVGLLNYSSITKNYLLHQQGPNGLASILKTISTGTWVKWVRG